MGTGCDNNDDRAGDFDADAVAELVRESFPAADDELIGRAVDQVREACAFDDETFAFYVAGVLDDMPDDLHLAATGCPDRWRWALEAIERG